MRPAIGAGFQEHGIHGRFGGEASGLRLQILRATDLSAVAAYTGVVRHVLGLERSNCDARRASARHNPVTTSDFPASEDVPATRTPLDPPASLPTGAVYGVST